MPRSKTAPKKNRNERREGGKDPGPKAFTRKRRRGTLQKGPRLEKEGGLTNEKPLRAGVPPTRSQNITGQNRGGRHKETYRTKRAWIINDAVLRAEHLDDEGGVREGTKLGRT